jgi:hypothetical protein
MQVIGFCRFSYPAMGGFQIEHETIEDRIAYLYSPDRIEERFRHFEAVCLPGLKAQTDGDFTFAILVGDQMPRAMRDRLNDLVSDMPQARIIARPPERHRKVCQDVLNDLRTPGQPCLQFRHDDDDAVSVDFVERLRLAVRDCAGLVARNRLVAFDWNRGFIAEADDRGLRAEACVQPYWGVAQALAVQAQAQLSIMNFAHFKIMQAMPTVTFHDEAMYVRGHNDHNDSRRGKREKPVVLPRLDAEGEAVFRDRFAIDADQVRHIFASAWVS